MFAALDAFEDFQGAVRSDGEFVYALKLVHDAQQFADDLHRRTRTPRG